MDVRVVGEHIRGRRNGHDVLVPLSRPVRGTRCRLRGVFFY
jgi:hypothetical protein